MYTMDFLSEINYLILSYLISYYLISHLIGKVKLKFQQDFQSRNTAQTLVELCAIRDELSICIDYLI